MNPPDNALRYLASKNALGKLASPVPVFFSHRGYRNAWQAARTRSRWHWSSFFTLPAFVRLS